MSDPREDFLRKIPRIESELRTLLNVINSLERAAEPGSKEARHLYYQR